MSRAGKDARSISGSWLDKLSHEYATLNAARGKFPTQFGIYNKDEFLIQERFKCTVIICQALG